jgi:hypothetical protein
MHQLFVADTDNVSQGGPDCKDVFAKKGNYFALLPYDIK